MAEILLDVRAIAPWDRHARILGIFDALPVGDAVVLTNDHDPRPLQHQFEGQRQGIFTWTYLDQGPELWRVRIGKAAPLPQQDSICCGHCGG